MSLLLRVVIAVVVFASRNNEACLSTRTMNMFTHRDARFVGDTRAQFQPKAPSSPFSDGNIKIFKGGIGPAAPSKCGHSRYYRHAADYRPASSSIVGGLSALPNEFPWIVRLQIINPITNISQLCSGNILSGHFIATAAHCVIDVLHWPRQIIAILGEHDLTEKVAPSFNKWAVAVSEINIHPEYSTTNNDNDIALLRVESKSIQISKFNVFFCCFVFASRKYAQQFA